MKKRNSFVVNFAIEEFVYLRKESLFFTYKYHSKTLSELYKNNSRLSAFLTYHCKYIKHLTLYTIYQDSPSNQNEQFNN